MKRYALLAATALAAAAALYFFNQKPAKTEAYYQAVAQYVYAFTSGDIGSEDAIRVRFVNAAVGKEQIGQPVASDVFDLSPAVPGQAVWEDDRTILLKPSAPLPFGKRYTGTVRLRRIYADAPAIAKVFEFQFHVRALAYEVVTDGIAADPGDLRQQRVLGRIRVNEAVGAADVEKMLTAKQGNKALLVSWTHNADGRTHEWAVEGVERSNARSKVNLSWSGRPIGVKNSGSAEQLVAPFDEFGVLSARAVQVEEQYVLVNFSDPVLSGQDLNGLIRIEGYNGKLRFVVDGNFVRVYPGARITGDHTLRIEAGIRNAAGQAMKDAFQTVLTFEDLKPAVRLVGRGAIIPQNANGGIIFPFEAVGLNAVDVEVFKIFNSNILQYLQVNEIEGEQELERVGRIVFQKKLDLAELNANASSKNWQRYALDLKDMIRQDPGAIYQIRLAFRRSYTNTGCSAEGDDETLAYLAERDENGNFVSLTGGYRGIYWQNQTNWYDYYDYEGEEGEGGGNNADDGRYRWDRREDPCAKEYYFNEHFARRNVFVSDLGLTAKRGKDNSLFLAVTDLHTAQPVSGLDIELFDFQLQSIGKTRTESDGTVTVEGLRGAPFVAVATGRDRRGYLRMADGGTLSLSRFDVVGAEPQKGLKGYLYGERGVWRPGDSIFLNFVLEDKTGKLPPTHPITFELSDPRGALQYKTVQTASVGGVYPLHCVTRLDAPTGNWMARVQVGGATFSQQLKIETVKPNRLKLDLDFGKKALSAADFTYPSKPSGGASGKLAVTWLHGAIAKGLKAKVEMHVRSTATTFSGYKGFSFDDPARSFYSEPQVLFDSTVNDNGIAAIPLKISDNESAPGKLIANFKVRAFEKSGDFSTDNFAMDVFPYENYVGVLIPTGQWGEKTIDPRGGNVTFAMLDKNGKPLANRRINVALYRCDWRWWWDEDRYSNVAQFNSADNVAGVEKAVLSTNANGQATWKVKVNDWGRYLVRVEDEASGHAAGDFFWRGYPDQLDDIKSRNAAAMLPFSVDKEKYMVGEEVTIKVPASENGRILLTLETGTRVAQHLWFDAKAGDNFLKFKVEPSMTPTVYAHVSLIQPHAQTVNDLPIRMYGVVPVNVENPASRLEAQLDMPDVLKPGEPFSVAFREKGGKACTYTLAIVDEGLLDLTRFKTPNPWDAFFAREGLGVKTWDIYDYVLGAYGASLERILAIGGDGLNQKAKNATQVNRFKPTVIHLGPFRLEKGQMAKHILKIENYVGSVRVMAVLSAPAPDGKGMYGCAEKTCPVRKPLMILPTLPRTLGPGESLRLPVDVFAMEKTVRDAVVTVREKSGLVSIGGTGQTSLTFAEPGDKMAYFDLKVGAKTGVARFSVTATGGGESTSADIELEVRNPNPLITRVLDGTIEPGQTWAQSGKTTDFSNLENATLEISSIPPINLSKQLDYLIQYPHGCIEQTTSAAFPQLYVDLIAPLSDKQKKEVQRNITAAIGKLQNFQMSSGAFSYWAGGNEVADWAGSYAGHFLMEARARGYAVPQQLLDKWIESQVKTSRTWEPGVDNDPHGWQHHDNEMSQAYRLYTLALAGKPDLAGMNRLREKKTKFESSLSLLAAAFATAGKSEAARDLLNDATAQKFGYTWWGYTYGSDLRDLALKLETLTAVGDTKRGLEAALLVASQVGDAARWYSTQEVATCLRALCKYAQKGTFGEKSDFVITENGRETPVNNSASYYLHPLGDDLSGGVSVKNTSKQKLYARIVLRGRPASGDLLAESKNISLNIRYTDTKGQAIDPAKLAQGTDFLAEVTVTRTEDMKFDFNEMALTQIFPSGWEILNTRMNLVGGSTSDPMDYQDVRDDRVMTYFDLPYNWSRNRNTKQSRTYRIQLNAAYAGRYYLPTVACEAMYDNRIRASVPGKWVEVI